MLSLYKPATIVGDPKYAKRFKNFESTFLMFLGPKNFLRPLCIQKFLRISENVGQGCSKLFENI
jgi:hypothetical protein